MLSNAISSLNDYCIDENEAHINDAINYLAAFREGNYSTIITDELNILIEELCSKDRDIEAIIDTISIMDNSINI